MRNLKKYLETCRKATPGPWNMVHGNKDQVVGSRERGIAVTIGENKQHNANFIAEAREGWPEAIQRAIQAEKALRMACDFIDELGADCSVCRDICKKEDCDNNTTNCWEEYFLLKARDQNGNNKS